MSYSLFNNRQEAGKKLAESLKRYAGQNDVVVLALPRGGVPVGLEISRALGVPFSVFVVRKIGVPGHEELALGAVASGGIRAINEDIRDALGIPESEIEYLAKNEL